MPSEEIQALSEEIDAAVEEISTAQAAGQELINEEAGEIENLPEKVKAVEKEVNVVFGKESEDVAEETKEAEETTGEESVSGDGDREETERSETTPTHDESAVERAVAAGIPVADANALTPASLERVISAREQAWQEQENREQLQRDKLNKGERLEEAKDEVDPFGQLPKLDPDKYEPEVIAAVEGLKDIARAQQKEIKDYRDRVELAQDTQNQVTMQELEVWFDGQIKGLGDDFVDALGEGGYSGLNQGSLQLQKRSEIVDQIGVMLAGYNAQGINAPPREDLFDAAARFVLKDRYSELTEKRIATDLKKQSSQHIQRSAGRKATGKLSPEEEAAAAIDSRWGE